MHRWHTCYNAPKLAQCLSPSPWCKKPYGSPWSVCSFLENQLDQSHMAFSVGDKQVTGSAAWHSNGHRSFLHKLNQTWLFNIVSFFHCFSPINGKGTWIYPRMTMYPFLSPKSINLRNPRVDLLPTPSPTFIRDAQAAACTLVCHSRFKSKGWWQT